MVHRPERGTPINNGIEGKRLLALSDRICDLLDDWIDTLRADVTDEEGREPFGVADDLVSGCNLQGHIACKGGVSDCLSRSQ